MSDNRAVCLNCMDGRTQIPVIEWIKKNHGFDYVDMVTEPGIDGMVADSDNSIDGIIRKINISIEKNHAQKIFIVAHYDCKGNPVDDNTHKECALKGSERLLKTFSALPVIPLWVNKDWNVEAL